ncbi:hypothetical protein TIFTF001_007576 [Ficus carica]|uniref:Uncharacterized protein n=1 Tax=Ficus carica TaxID=3494 RepID=A0AA87ZQF6_FICCA|nr:hypothetical protein TIFTF001_007576 [Ficus carica]
MAFLSPEYFHSDKNIVIFFILFTATLSLCLPSSVAELQYFRHRAKADGSLSFLVVGDWGRQGLYNQSEVALQSPRTPDCEIAERLSSTRHHLPDQLMTTIVDSRRDDDIDSREES